MVASRTAARPTAVIIVDIENLQRSLEKKLSIQDVDHKGLIELASEGFDLRRVIYYLATESMYDRLACKLEHVPSTLQLVEKDGLGRQNLADRAIINELKFVAKDADVIILFSGDGDFIDALDWMSAEGKRVVIISTLDDLSKGYMTPAGYDYEIRLLEDMYEQLHQTRTTEKTGGT